MSTLSQKQSRSLPPIFSLPEEILEEIVSELHQHKDLIALALTSRACADAVIPHHTQYRVLRVRHPLPDMWAHLARRSDLARNIREVHICERTNYQMPDHYPTTLIDDKQDRSWKNADESARVRNICQALSHMHRLRVFNWSWRDVPQQIRPTSHPAHENAILTVVSRLPSLEVLRLNGNFAMHALSSTHDPNSLTYPLWGIANLRSLTLSGDIWAKLGNSRHICALLARSSNLEYLEVPLEFYHLSDCRLPNLKKLKLQMQSGANMSIDRSRALFLRNHPTIEELNWSPIGNPTIPSAVLPNLKSLNTNRQFILAMDDPHFGFGGSNGAFDNLSTPPATPSTPMAPSSPGLDVSFDPPEESRMLRRIESLRVNGLDAQTLLGLKCLDRTSLRKLCLHAFGDISTLYEVAEAFPNIEWLSLPPVHLPLDSPHPVIMSSDQWLDILPRFKKLQVFRGEGLWVTVKNNLESMHHLINNLAFKCPSLRELNHQVHHDKWNAYKRILISRQGEEGEVISYQVTNPRHSNPFDVMDGIFD